MYVGMVQSLMIVTVFIDALGYELSLLQYSVVGIIFLILALLVGFLDTRLGLRQEELNNHALQNPVNMEMLQRIKDLQDQMKRLEQDDQLKKAS